MAWSFFGMLSHAKRGGKANGLCGEIDTFLLRKQLKPAEVLIETCRDIDRCLLRCCHAAAEILPYCRRGVKLVDLKKAFSCGINVHRWWLALALSDIFTEYAF